LFLIESTSGTWNNLSNKDANRQNFLNYAKEIDEVKNKRLKVAHCILLLRKDEEATLLEQFKSKS